jgi:hypothetical protein
MQELKGNHYGHGPDSDSGRSPSDDEKVVGTSKHLGHGEELPPDPDAGLSAEERAKIVSESH